MDKVGLSVRQAASQTKLLMVFGTRPEAIKMAPLVSEIRRHDSLSLAVCVTGQHRQMLDEVLNLFGITPHFDLDVMSERQTLPSLTSKILLGLEVVIEQWQPDIVLVQGDTSTTFCAALAAYYFRIPVAHIEAGLRTHNIYSPWPEEINRQLTGTLARYHFAPTSLAQENLLNEGVDEKRVFVTGNTVIDALLVVRNKIEQSATLSSDLDKAFAYLDPTKRLVLVTGHRRENFGERFEKICEALLTVAKRFDDCQILYPVHLNPNVQEPVNRLLSCTTNIHLVPPLSYLEFVYIMSRAYLILTDSGGIQEEAPALGKPVLVMRETTERLEGVAAGTVKLVGVGTESIVEQVGILLTDDDVYKRMSMAHNPYGDGNASQKIVSELVKQLLHSAKETSLQTELLECVADDI